MPHTSHIDSNTTRASSVVGASLSTEFLPSSGDGWVLLAPWGEWPHAQGIDQVLDREAADNLIAQWVSENRPEILVDFDHASFDPSRASVAAGWIQDLQARDDGLYIRIRWTDIGDQALRGGRYRYLSALWQITSLSSDRGRPWRLLSVGLTNQPNIPTPALANRQTPQPENDMKNIAVTLGLDAAASESSIIEAIKKLQGDKTSLKNRADKAESELTTLQNSVVEADLEEFKDVIEDEEQTKELLLANREATRKLLAAATPSKPAESPKTLANSKPPQAPKGEGPEPTQAEKQDAAVRDYKLANRCSYEEAWEAVQRKQPALFRTAKSED